jgi:hypothetical protein
MEVSKQSRQTLPQHTATARQLMQHMEAIQLHEAVQTLLEAMHLQGNVKSADVQCEVAQRTAPQSAHGPQRSMYSTMAVLSMLPCALA